MDFPRKLYRMGEVMRYSGFSRQTLHHYTLLGLITEDDRTEAGHRLYSEQVFDTLRRIDELKQTDKTLQEIREILKNESEISLVGEK
jgi:DNA-binding transcriptional MerR regulator